MVEKMDVRRGRRVEGCRKGANRNENGLDEW